MKPGAPKSYQRARRPAFFLAMLALWLLLWGSLSVGILLLGLLFALAGTAALAMLEMPPTRLRRLSLVPGLIRDVAREVLRSNLAVTKIILGRREARTRRSGFVEVPLDMRSPHGLAVLACILTATPGTVWVDHDPARRTMLLHVLDLVDEAVWVNIIKQTWEKRLMEIFE